MSFVRKAIKGITGGLGLTAPENVGSGAQQAAVNAQNQAVAALQSVGVPSIESQRIVLEHPELILSSPEERLDGTALADIIEDPTLRQNIVDAIQEMKIRGVEGFTPEDRARFEEMQEKTGAAEAARRATILQSMAERGALDSGAQLAAQLQSSQAATQEQARGGRQLAAEAARARREALGQAASMSSGLRAQDYTQQANLAQARDAIARFNAAVAGRDTAARQAHEQQTTGLTNQQEMANKALIQQKFINELEKAGGQARQLGNVAQQQSQIAAQQAQAAQNQAAGFRGLLGTAAKVALPLALPGTFGTAAGLGALSSFEDGGVKQPEMAEMPSMDNPEKEEKINPEERAKKVQNAMERLQGSDLGDIASATNQNPIEALAALRARPEMTNPEQIKQNTMQELHEQKMRQQEEQHQLKQEMQRKMMEQRLQHQERKFAEGGIKKESEQPMEMMGSEDNAMPQTENGRIIPGENFTGDELPDRINSGEMVLNLDQQDTVMGLLQELGQLREDKAVEAGLAEVNPEQQQALLDVANQEMQPEDLPTEEGIVEATPESKNALMQLLGMNQP